LRSNKLSLLSAASAYCSSVTINHGYLHFIEKDANEQLTRAEEFLELAEQIIGVVP
jgi:hypothetical protein